MPSESADVDETPTTGAGQEFSVTPQNTFEFIPGPLTGISCPSCFKDQLLRDVIHEGECNSCGTDLELRLRTGPGE